MPLTFSETVALVRDLAFLSLIVAGAFVSLGLYRKGSRTVRSARKAKEAVEAMLSALSEGGSEPKRSGGASATRGVLALLRRLARRGGERRGTGE